ncbi:uncharacterized protein LOC142230733 [Haematobia irritans]|uniref:uncharacterized protein LOC142230733 n=1 Tax=Haematobia irritans TaxID=7368 RepID=UPI003F500982
MFVSLVHNNQVLSNVQKFYYLRSSCRDTPLSIVNEYPAYDASYQTAWSALTKRYHNKRKIADTIFRRLFDIARSDGSCDSIKNLLDTTRTCLSLLSTLKINCDNWDPILVHITVSKLDTQTCKEWERSLNASTEIPKIGELFLFLETTFRTLESINDHDLTTSRTVSRSASSFRPLQTRRVHVVSTRDGNCPCCGRRHLLYKCFQFLAASPAAKRDLISSKGICRNCLNVGHFSRDCRLQTRCHVCNMPHHTIVHNKYSEDGPTLSATAVTSGNSAGVSTDITESQANIRSCNISILNSTVMPNVLLATVRVIVRTQYGEFKLRALLDQGAQATLITEEAVQLLGLRRYRTYAHITGVGGSTVIVRNYVNFCLISPCEKKFRLESNAFEELLEQREFTREEDLCEEYFKATYKRGDDGRYTVALPFRSEVLGKPLPAFCHTDFSALSRLKNMETRFNRDVGLAAQYREFMEEILQQLAMDEYDSYPVACDVLKTDTYVDDVISGADTLTEALTGLRTSVDLMNAIPEEFREKRGIVDFDEQDLVKALGLGWNTLDDTFAFKVDFQPRENVTKSDVLSDAARLYDPLGWLAPVTITAKDSVSDSIRKEWNKYLGELIHLENIRIPRWLGTLRNSKLELHGFCDASQTAFAAVIHAKSTNDGYHVKYCPDFNRWQNWCVLRLIYCASSTIKENDKHKSGFLTTGELHEALNILVIQSQRVEFSEELNHLKKCHPFPSSNRLAQLCPFVDEIGILRVGGRLQKAKFDYEFKHPILLSKNNPLSILLFSDAHMKTLHGGLTQMQAYVTRKYWVISARNIAKQVQRKCVTCFKYTAKAAQEIMGELPSVRLQPTRAFKHSGVDYAGLITIKQSTARNSRRLQVCPLSHSSQHSEDSPPAVEYVRTCSLTAVRTSLAQIRNIRFCNIDVNYHCPKISASFFQTVEQNGTLYHQHRPTLKRTMDNRILKFEELTTLLAQIKSCLNSRPLCPLSTDPNDCSALTPGHFLIGEPLLTIPDENLLDCSIDRLSRWKVVEILKQQFWKRWVVEYVNRLQSRPKWLNPQTNPELGDLVLICDERLPPGQWPLARITEVHPGTDGRVRVVSVISNGKTYKRPVSKIALLPVKDEFQLPTNSTDELL